MKYPVENQPFDYLTDDSRICDDRCAFVLTEQNFRYLETIKKKKNVKILSPKIVQDIYDIKNLKIVGITGTNGKTTTSAAIYSILLDLGVKTAFQGSRGLFINDEKIAKKTHTTPPILTTLYHMYLAKKAGCEFFIMEVSSHAIAQKRIESLDFKLKIFTNITQDHLDYHGSFEEYMRIKSGFFMDDALKLINKDAKKIDFNIKNTYTYALDVPASFNILAYSLNNGITAVIKHFETQEEFHSPLYGFFNLYNITAAIAAVKLITNYSLFEICAKVENFAGVGGRMEAVSQRPLVIVDFAHTPDGMEKVLDSLKEKKISIVFGAGGERDKSKRVMMGRVANRYAKKIYLTNDNPRSEDPISIINDIKKGILDTKKLKVIPDRKEAIYEAVSELEDEEILMILGKGDEEYIEINKQKIPFDDREVVRAIMKEKFNR